MPVARIFTLTTPYTAAEALQLGYSQTRDIMFLTHLNHPVQALKRFDHHVWTIADAQFGTSVTAPVAPAAVATTPNTGTGYAPTAASYVVTTVLADGRESLPSPAGTCTNDLNLQGNYNTLTITAVAGAQEYTVYKAVNGIYGFVGVAGGLTFKDQNIGPDLSDTPPSDRQPFSASDAKPAVVTIHQQRATFARTLAQPSLVQASQSGDFLNMDVSRPAKADDAVSFSLNGEQVNAIQHIVSIKKVLVALTDTAVWSVGSSGNFLAPDDIVPQLESKRGSSRVRPVLVDDVLFFNTSKGSSIRTLGYTFEVDGYKGNDITVFAPHFFRKLGVTWMAWAEHPMSVLWAGRSDGKLLALTWQAEQQVWGWSLCETNGFVESGCVITENGEDVLYVVVARRIGAATRRFVERMTSPAWQTVDDAVYLDSARSYSGAPATVFTGLDHLEGSQVGVLADGGVLYKTVTGGKITLPAAARKVHVGLPYEAWARTLPPPTPGIGGKAQQVTQAVLALIKTRGIEVGSAKSLPAGQFEPVNSIDETAAIYPIKRSHEAQYAPVAPIFSGKVEVDMPPTDWIEAGLIVRQRYPLPMTVTAIYYDNDVGT